MLKRSSWLAAVLSAFTILGNAHALTYSLDTGPYSTLGPSIGFDAIILNPFTAIPGATTIGSISVRWSDIALPETVGLALLEDPNDDGFFADAVLLQSIAVAYDGTSNGTFETFAIPHTIVSGIFGVAAYAENAADNIFPVAIEGPAAPWDGGFASQGHFADITEAARNPGTLFRDAAIRAISVPEPASILLVGIALAGLGFSRRARTALGL